MIKADPNEQRKKSLVDGLAFDAPPGSPGAAPPPPMSDGGGPVRFDAPPGSPGAVPPPKMSGGGPVAFDAPPGSPGAVPPPTMNDGGKPVRFDAPPGSPGAVPPPTMNGGPEYRSPTLDGPGQDATMPPGATDMGNGLVRLANGQVVPRDHPLFLDAQRGGAPGAPPAPAPGGPPPAGDFPSLPPGATPPPGYYDPISGKTAGAPGAPAGAPPAAPGAPAGAPPAPAPPGAPPAAPPAPGAPPAPPTTVNDAYKQALMKGLTGKAPTLSDPELKGQSDAYAVQQQRAKERSREALAGRRGAQGQLSDLAGSGAFDGDLVGLEQQQGEAQAGFDSNLLGSAAKSQRDELLKYAALAGQTLDAESGRALSEKLAMLNAQIQREGLAQQGRLGDEGNAIDRERIKQTGTLGQSDIDLRRMLGSGQLNLGLLTQLLGNQQYDKGLSADLGKFNSSQNSDALMKLLGYM